jgi:hypothetical protein
MADQIKTVTDSSQFPMIINRFFTGSNVFIKTKSGNLYLQFLGFSEGRIAYRIPRVKNLPELVQVITRHNHTTINAKMKFVERNEDTFIFTPQMFQVLVVVRKEGRASLDGGESKSIIYIEKVISDFIISNELTMNDKKVDHIKEIVTFDLEKQFQNIVVRFISESGRDIRMKHFATNIRPIFIPDLNREPDKRFEKDYKFYINEIYANDYKLSSKHEFISEASAPILIRNMIPYGYLQVNNTAPMTDGHFSAVKRMAVVINELFRKNNLFQPSSDKILVSDLSRNGLGVVFKERKIARLFKKGSMVSFEMMLPTKKKVIMGAVVRNVSFLENSIIKAGFEIRLIDALSEVHYEEFIETLPVPKEPPPKPPPDAKNPAVDELTGEEAEKQPGETGDEMVE